MSGGLVGLLDDVAALAKVAAASIDDVGAAAGRASVQSAGQVGRGPLRRFIVSFWIVLYK